jgi:hypothetical protein
MALTNQDFFFAYFAAGKNAEALEILETIDEVVFTKDQLENFVKNMDESFMVHFHKFNIDVNQVIKISREFRSDIASRNIRFLFKYGLVPKDEAVLTDILEIYSFFPSDQINPDKFKVRVQLTLDYFGVIGENVVVNFFKKCRNNLSNPTHNIIMDTLIEYTSIDISGIVNDLAKNVSLGTDAITWLISKAGNKFDVNKHAIRILLAHSEDLSKTYTSKKVVDMLLENGLDLTNDLIIEFLLRLCFETDVVYKIPEDGPFSFGAFGNYCKIFDMINDQGLYVEADHREIVFDAFTTNLYYDGNGCMTVEHMHMALDKMLDRGFDIVELFEKQTQESDDNISLYCYNSDIMDYILAKIDMPSLPKTWQLMSFLENAYSASSPIIHKILAESFDELSANLVYVEYRYLLMNLSGMSLRLCLGIVLKSDPNKLLDFVNIYCDNNDNGDIETIFDFFVENDLDTTKIIAHLGLCGDVDRFKLIHDKIYGSDTKALYDFLLHVAKHYFNYGCASIVKPLINYLLGILTEDFQHEVRKLFDTEYTLIITLCRKIEMIDTQLIKLLTGIEPEEFWSITFFKLVKMDRWHAMHTHYMLSIIAHVMENGFDVQPYLKILHDNLAQELTSRQLGTKFGDVIKIFIENSDYDLDEVKQFIIKCKPKASIEMFTEYESFGLFFNETEQEYLMI